MRFLIVGASGDVGSATLRALLSAGAELRALTRHPERQVPEDRLEWMRFAFSPDTPPAEIFEGIDGMLFVRPAAVADVPGLIEPFLRAAVEAGVAHIVFLSVLGANRIPFIPHYRIERVLDGLSCATDMLRASFFMQNLTTVFGAWIRDDGEMVVPAGRGRTSFVDTRDIGQAAARLLLDGPGGRRAWTITGPEAISHAEVARRAEERYAVRIPYRSVSRCRFVREATARGWSRDYARFVARIYLTVRFGLSRTVSYDLPRLLGRPATRIDRFLDDYRGDLLGRPPGRPTGQ